MTWLNEKPNTEGLRLIERLSTEFEVFLVLLSAVIAADVSLYFYEKQNILTFNWKFGGEIKGGEINIGAILIFILLFSFMMTFVSGLFVVALKFVWGELPYKLTSRIDRNRDFDYSKHGYVLDHELEWHALSEKDAFMLDLVRRHFGATQE